MTLSIALSSLALAFTFSQASNANITNLTCSIRTSTGHYLKAVGGGGRTTDVLHSDAVRVDAWERFLLIATTDVSHGEVHYGLRTHTGNYLTAMGSGGKTTDVIHSNASQLQDWEKFQLVSLGNNRYALRTKSGNYLTAVGGGGRTTDVVHTDATQIGAWEVFTLNCGN